MINFIGQYKFSDYGCNNMKNVLITFIKIGMAGILSLILLSFFCYFYEFMGVYATCSDNSTDSKYAADTRVSNMVEGFGQLTLDSNGYNNIDNTPLSEKPVNILYMGSSNSEGFQVDADENVTHLLDEKLPNLRVYSIAMSGHFLDTNVNNLADAVKAYNPTDYVIIETPYINPSEGAMTAALTPRPSEPVCDTATKLAINKYCCSIRSLNRAKSDIMLGSSSPVNLLSESFSTLSLVAHAKGNASDNESYEECLDTFLSYADDCMPENCKLIIIWHTPVKFNSTGDLLVNEEKAEQSRIFKEDCDKNGIIFVDMTDRLQKLYSNNHVFAHGFENTGINEGHLNRHGHKALADALYETILSDMEAEL
ncbi:MAG: hypothetical protein HUJ98_03175 [Bacteroidaceae bacterium]|nr:hypothetical protein [Bacteroidaceae bacterium]